MSTIRTAKFFIIGKTSITKKPSPSQVASLKTIRSNENVKKKILICGIGNTIRGDDVIGILLARQLRKEQIPDAEIREMETAGFEILDEMTDFSKVIILDAMKTNEEEEVGKVVVSSLEEGRPSVSLLPSHGFDFAGLVKAFQKAQPGRIPKDINFILVKVQRVDEFHEGLSPRLEKDFPLILENVKRALNQILQYTG